MWATWQNISPLSEKVGETRPSCPPPNCAHAHPNVCLVIVLNQWFLKRAVSISRGQF